MPKLIENLKQRLTEETRRQLRQFGYSAVTIRSVARACGVGAGTVYNYFSSKEELLASSMLEDWVRCVEAVEQAAAQSAHAEPAVRCLYAQLCGFSKQYEAVFQDEQAISGYAGVLNRYHGMLRRQLSAPLRKYCESDFAADFIAEAVLTWTVAGKEFEEIYSVVKKLL